MNVKLPQDIRLWLNSRGLFDEVIDGARLHLTSRGIAIPVTKDNGREFNKYRRHPAVFVGDKYTCDPGGGVSLYRWKEASEYDVIFVTEGELDALRLWSLKIPAVSSTGGASSWKHAWSSRFIGKTVFVWYDADEAGDDGAERTTQSLVDYADKLFRIRHRPEDGKDITDFLKGTMTSSIDEIRKDKRLVVTKVRKKPPKARFISFDHDSEKPPLDVVLRHYDIEPQDVQASAHCPLHDDEHPSFSYNLSLGLWKCHAGCGAGDVYTLVMLKEDLSFIEAKNFISQL